MSSPAGAAPPFPARKPTIGMAVLLAVLSMVSPLSIDTFFPSFRAMAEELHLADWQVQQTLTAYMLPYAFFTLVHGPLSDALGRRRMIATGMTFYTLASVGCVFAPTFTVLLVCRFLQGVAAGMGPTIARAVLRDLYEGPQAQRLMSVMLMVFSVAPAVGPIIGGWIHVAFGWRAVFGFMVIVGAGLLTACLALLPETHPPEKRVPLHLGSLVRTSIQVMSHGRFMLLGLAGSLAIGSVLAYMGSAPYIVMDQWHLEETQFFYLFGPVIGGFIIGLFLSGRFAGRVAPRSQLFGGFGLMLAGASVMAVWQLITSPSILADQILLFTIAVGAQLIFPVLTLEMLDLFPKARGTAAAVQSFITLGFASLVIGAVVPAIDGMLPVLSKISIGGVVLAIICWWLAARRGPRLR